MHTTSLHYRLGWNPVAKKIQTMLLGTVLISLSRPYSPQTYRPHSVIHSQPDARGEPDCHYPLDSTKLKQPSDKKQKSVHNLPLTANQPGT